jgi:hypothetical protein
VIPKPRVFPRPTWGMATAIPTTATICAKANRTYKVVGFKASRVDRVATPYPPDQQKQAEKDGNNGAREHAR